MSKLTREELHVIENALNVATTKCEDLLKELSPKEVDENLMIVSMMKLQIKNQQELKEKIMDINYGDVNEIEIV